MIRVGVIGYGYWGPNLARNFAAEKAFTLAAVCDTQADRLGLAAERLPTARLTADARSLIAAPDIDAVAIATPVSTHFDLAIAALRAGKHVLVAKPAATRGDDVLRLIDEAAARGRVLMADHTYVYTGAVRRIRDIVAGGGLGEIRYYDSVRVNLGLFQHDVNVVWDLAPHDLSIMDYVLPERPVAVSATGISHVPGGGENIAYLTYFYDGPMIAHVGVNWLAPVKVRNVLIGGSDKMVVFDDLQPSEKVKVYASGITVTPAAGPEEVYRTMVGYRTGDMWAPALDRTEALATEVRHFADCIASGAPPLTDGFAALRMVRALEAATASLRNRGQPTALAPLDRAA
ncbi:MAG: Gfo/Idh/MocA family protein [Rhodospirillaceae bacterium]